MKGEIDINKLLEMETGTKIKYSAQTFHDGVFLIGGIFGGQKVLIRADGEIIPENKDNPFLFTDSKLTRNAVRRVRNKDSLLGRLILDWLVELFSTYLFFKDSRITLLLSLWVMGTYVFKMFLYYGYLLMLAGLQKVPNLGLVVPS